MNYVIIDGYGLAYRSYYAFSALKTTTGISSGCMYGFLIGLRTVKNKFPYCHIIVAWDKDPKRKKRVFADYKANRNHSVSFFDKDDLKQALVNINITQAECDGEEADDVIASLVKKYSTDENQIFIYSSDKDFFQLVQDGRVIIIRPKSEKYPEKYYDEEMVKNEYGVNSKDFLLFQIFRGDSIDNIPGTKRISSSVLINLVNKYKTINSVYENLDKESLTKYQRDTLTAFKEQAIINFELMKLRDDLDLTIFEGNPNSEQLDYFLNKYEIKSIRANEYVNIFMDIPSHIKKGPAVKSYSLFDDGD